MGVVQKTPLALHVPPPLCGGWHHHWVLSISSMSQDDLMKEKSDNLNNIIHFIVHFNTNLMTVCTILHGHWHFIQDDDSLRSFTAATPMTVLKRNNKLMTF